MNRSRICSQLPCLIALLLYAALPAGAEPLAYVARPARNDIAVIDVRTHSVIGGIPTLEPSDFVAVHPSGIIGYAGALDSDTSVLETVRSVVTQPVRLQGAGPIDATAIVFEPGGSFAYVGRGFEDVAVVDLATHETIGDFDGSSWVEQLLLLAERNQLVVLGGGRLQVFDTTTRERDHQATQDLRAVVEEGAYPTDMHASDDGFLYFAKGDEIWQVVRSELSHHKIPSLRIRVGEPVRQVVSDPTGGWLFAAGSSEVHVLCLLGGACPEPPTQRIDLRALDSISDIGRTLDGSEIWVVGQNEIAVIDTATRQHIHTFAVAAGGGALARMDFAPAVGCEPRSTSLMALRLEINLLDTSSRTQSALRNRVNNAVEELAADDLDGARNQLKSFVSAVAYRANLNRKHRNSIETDEAHGLLCSAGVILGRLVQGVADHE